MINSVGISGSRRAENLIIRIIPFVLISRQCSAILESLLTFLDGVQMHRAYVHELQRLVLREMSGLNRIRYHEKLSVLARQFVSAVHDLLEIYRLGRKIRIFDSYLL